MNQQPVRVRSVFAGLLRLLVLLVLLMVLVIAWLPLAIPWLLQKQGIQLQWQQPRWSLNSLQLQQLSLTHTDFQLTANQIQLDWLWQKRPLQKLHIDQLDVQARLPDNNNQEETDNSLPLSLATWLPTSVKVGQLYADIEELALFSGHLYVQANPGGVLWQPVNLSIDLSVEQLAPQWLQSIPHELHPDSLRIRTLSSPDLPRPPHSLQTLVLDIHSLGQTNLQLSGIVNLQNKTGWYAMLDQARLHFDIPEYQQDGLHVKGIQGQLYFSASADEEQAQLQLTQPASVQLALLQPDEDTQLEQVTLTLSSLQLNSSQQSALELDLTTQYQLSTAKLKHPLLRSQVWGASGTVSGTANALNIHAAIHNTDGLQLDSRWGWQNGSLEGELQLQEIFLRAGNPLAKTFPDWPELVEFNNGQLNGQARINWPANQTDPDISGAFSGRGLSGILNRSELAGLEFNGDFRLDPNFKLRLQLPRLEIAELNPGVPIQQLRILDAHFSADLDHPLQGRLSWEDIRGELLGGSFSLAANQFKLDNSNSVQLRLSGLQLQEALVLYPTEGLYGQATIDGSLPLVLSLKGVFIDQGQLQARQPGTLRFHSEQVRAIGQTNPSMKLVTDALEDFHFSWLSSELAYEPSGKLLFKVRLEGKNPAIEQGRPIHLNLSLEEDLPALLASIQLSNHVSETIQERIRQRLQNR